MEINTSILMDSYDINSHTMALAHNFDHSLEILSFKRFCQPMLVWDSAALLRRIRLALSYAPKGGEDEMRHLYQGDARSVEGRALSHAICLG
jgi:hypothetical protein